MTRSTRCAVAVAFLALVGFTLAMVGDGGGGDGGPSTAAELEARLARVAELRAARELGRELEELYAAVEPFHDVGVAVESGYAPSSPCMASALGAQGVHYGKDALFVPEVVAQTPQLLMYEPRSDGTLRFIGVEYLVFQEAWHAAGFEQRPQLFGQEFGLNETLLDEPFYLLHVWIGQFNPVGVFADWNPLVGCAFDEATREGVGHARH